MWEAKGGCSSQPRPPPATSSLSRSGSEGRLTVAREDVTKEGVGQTDDDQQQIGRVASKSESGGGRKGSQALMGGQLVDAPGYMMRSSCVTGSLCSVVLEPFMICKACYSFRKHFAKLLASTKDSLEPGNTASVHTPELRLCILQPISRLVRKLIS